MFLTHTTTSAMGLFFGLTGALTLIGFTKLLFQCFITFIRPPDETPATQQTEQIASQLMGVGDAWTPQEFMDWQDSLADHHESVNQWERIGRYTVTLAQLAVGGYAAWVGALQSAGTAAAAGASGYVPAGLTTSELVTGAAAGSVAAGGAGAAGAGSGAGVGGATGIGVHELMSPTIWQEFGASTAPSAGASYSGPAVELMHPSIWEAAGAGSAGLGGSAPALYQIAPDAASGPLPTEVPGAPTGPAPSTGPSGSVSPVETPTSVPTNPQDTFLDKVSTRLKSGLKSSLVNKAINTGTEMLRPGSSQEPLPPLPQAQGGAYGGGLGMDQAYSPESALSKLAAIPGAGSTSGSGLLEAAGGGYTAPVTPTASASSVPSVGPVSPTAATASQREQELKGRYQVRTLEDFLRNKLAERERMRRARFVA